MIGGLAYLVVEILPDFSRSISVHSTHRENCHFKAAPKPAIIIVEVYIQGARCSSTRQLQVLEARTKQGLRGGPTLASADRQAHSSCCVCHLSSDCGIEFSERLMEFKIHRAPANHRIQNS
jgi:hypothetical protein